MGQSFSPPVHLPDFGPLLLSHKCHFTVAHLGPTVDFVGCCCSRRRLPLGPLAEHPRGVERQERGTPGRAVEFPWLVPTVWGPMSAKLRVLPNQAPPSMEAHFSESTPWPLVPAQPPLTHTAEVLSVLPCPTLANFRSKVNAHGPWGKRGSAQKDSRLGKDVSAPTHVCWVRQAMFLG